jgi:phosphatidylserine decarboxylase
MKEFKLPLSLQKTSLWDSGNPPVIKFRYVLQICLFISELKGRLRSAKYQSYDALRQHFWRQYLRQYDTDDTGSMSQIELRSMLDSLGSTLTKSTIASFFTRFGKNPEEEEISIDQAVQCLEAELGRPDSEKKHIDGDESQDTSMSATPLLLASGPKGEKIDLDSLDFSGPAHVSEDTNDNNKPRIPPPQPTEGMQRPLLEVAVGTDGTVSSSDAEGELSSGTASSSAEKAKKSRFGGVRRIGKAKKESSGDSSPSSDSVERVINVKNCPLCHRARLNDKAEMDIITHLAICASQDWHQVDKIMVGNFVTASQAQRKWYTKVIGKLSAGNYRLGAVSNREISPFAQSKTFGRILQTLSSKIGLQDNWRKRKCRYMFDLESACCTKGRQAAWKAHEVSPSFPFLGFCIN